MHRSTDFDYELPEERIAQRPAEPRDASKLLVARAKGRLGCFHSPFEFDDRVFRDLSQLLGPDDWLVMNDAKVLPVRMLGRRFDGTGAVEALLLRKLSSDNEWAALLHLSARVRPGLKIVFEPDVVAEVISTHEERVATEGEVRLRFGGIALESRSFESWLEKHGHIPLPPYIERQDSERDKLDYQTVYAARTGSAAAPTAGLHFTPTLLRALDEKGVRRSTITLHVGIGTFRPMKAENIEDHVMHEETFEISREFAAEFAEVRRQTRRCVAVGTTVVRTLESWVRACAKNGVVPGAPESAGIFKTRLFVKPGFRFEVVDDLITNFHLPRSSLLVLVGGAMGVEPMHEAYRRALAGGYRFFSYGDAMLIRGFDHA